MKHSSGVYRKRRAGAGAVAVAVLVALGLGAYALVDVTGGGGSGGGGGAKVAVGTRAGGSATTASTAPTTTVPPVPPEPGGGTTLFPSHRFVAYYGAPDDPTLGVLGEAPPAALWPRVVAAATPFAAPGVTVIPSLELIAYVAQAAAGNGTYAEMLPSAEIDSYLAAVKAQGGMLILDIQPGSGDFLTDAQSLAPWLAQPDVGLALDPEWKLQPGQKPLQQIGHTDAASINAVSSWLSQFTAAHHLPQKLLLVHQFQVQMVQDKQDVASPANLGIVFNMDGFGSTADKVGDYQSLASDPRFTLGYKLFYSRDHPLQTPAEVLALTPPPLVIEYE